MHDFSNSAMLGIVGADYDALLVHLGEQLTAVLRRAGWPEDEAPKCACDILTSTWLETLTANEWLTVAGLRLNVDTSGCVGA